MGKEDDVPRKLMLTMCRRMIAFNLPCMVQMFPKSFDRLMPFVDSFATDSDDEVRLSLASSYHEILMQHDSKAALLQPFMELIRSGSAEVVAKVCWFSLRRFGSSIVKSNFKKGSDNNAKIL
ncbi:unnamed protein product [Nippostrongylus brasiliensis]|uniref:Importin-5 n=1 Tax=Nippostrongylus brasiliensis TaxID=27835 RepID=A0A0N4YZU0_NIPBR|nr:unnamed protein product [Nippostrongylus brasiliensis]